MAICYQSQGLRIFPVRPGVKGPYKKDSWGDRLRKSSMVRLPTVDDIHDFWDRYPEANIAFFPGPESGVSVIDLDVKKHVDGRETLKGNGLGFLIDDALRVHTPSGGLHLYFKYTPALPDYVNAAETHGIDIRNSTKGYILMPPSSAVPKDSQGGNTFVEYRFEGIDPYGFLVDQLPNFPDLPDPDFFGKLRKQGTKPKKGKDKKRPYKDLPTAYLSPGTGVTQRTWSEKEVERNRKRQEQKNILKGQLASSKIIDFTNSQNKLQQLVSEQGDPYEGERPLPKRQARKAAEGLVDRLRKKNYLQVPPSEHCSYHRVYAKYQIHGIHYWVLLRFSHKYKPDSTLPRVWESQDGTTYVKWEGEMVSLNFDERYPVEEYLSREIPPPSSSRNKGI
jgi:hypothetical protein